MGLWEEGKEVCYDDIETAFDCWRDIIDLLFHDQESHLLNIETTKGIALKSPDGVDLLNPVECKNRLQIHRVFQKIQIEGLKSRIEGKEREMQSFLASSKRQLLEQDGFQGSSSMSDANGP